MSGGVQPAGVVTPPASSGSRARRAPCASPPTCPSAASRRPSLIEQVIADGRPLPFPDGARPSSRRRQARDPLHVDPPGVAGAAAVQDTGWKGFERDWTAAGQRRVAYYTNLPAGRYRFHVVGLRDERAAATRRRASWPSTGGRISTRRAGSWPLLRHLVAPAAWGAYRLHVRSIRRQFAAVLEERNRLAREMHDTLIQGCVGVSTLLEAASHAQDVSPEPRPRAARSRARRGARAPWTRRGWRCGTCATARRTAIEPGARRVAAGPAHRPRRRASGSEVEIAGSPVPSAARPSAACSCSSGRRFRTPSGTPRRSRLSVSLRFERRQLHVSIEDDGAGSTRRSTSRRTASLRPHRHAGARREAGWRVPPDERARRGHAGALADSAREVNTRRLAGRRDPEGSGSSNPRDPRSRGLSGVLHRGSSSDSPPIPPA